MLSKHLISSVLTQVPVFILGVLSGVFSTRILGDEGKGVFSLFQANAQLFVLVFSLGIQTGIVYFISSKKINERYVIGMAISVFGVCSLLLIGLLILSSLIDAGNFFLPEGYTSPVYLMALFIMFLLSFLNSILGAVFQAHSKFNTINFIALTNSIINVLVFTSLFFMFESETKSASERFNTILGITISVLLINSLLWLYNYSRNIALKPDFNFDFKNQFKTFISYNTSIYIGMFINFFNYRLDLWIVNHYLNDKELSYYSLAANINQIILFLAVTIASVMLPNLSGKSETERTETFIKVSRLCFALFFLITFIGYLLSAWIIPFMYGSEFESTVTPFQVILPGMLFSCITQVFSIYIVSSNRNIYNITACSIGLIFTLILDLWLIPQLGIYGAAIATTLSYFAIFVVTYIFVINHTKKRTLNLFIPLPGDVRQVIHLLSSRAK